MLGLVRGEAAAAPEQSAIEPDYRSHLRAADHLLRSGRGADAVPELVRALEMGGEEARSAVDELLKPTGLPARRKETG